MKTNSFLFAALCLLIISCDEEGPVKEPKEKPPCIISSVIDEEGEDPIIFDYNEDYDIISITGNGGYKYTYSYINDKINHVEITADNAIGNIEVTYSNDKLTSLYFVDENGLLSLRIDYFYDNGDITKEEWYNADENGEVKLEWYNEYTVENGNIVKSEYYGINDDGIPVFSIYEYTYSDDENKLQGNTPLYIQNLDQLLYFNKNLQVSRNYIRPNSDHHLTTYSYTFNEKGYMTRQSLSDRFGERDEYFNIDYDCDESNP